LLRTLEMQHQADVLDVLKKGIINEDIEKILRQIVKDLSDQYKK